MTTIAMDKNGLIAYDSRETAGSTIVDDNCNKCKESNGVYYFFCGRSADEDTLIDAVENGERPSYPDAISTHAIIVMGKDVYTAGITKEDGYYWQKERKGNPLSRGSGADHAMTAMDLGCSAKKAVKYAMKRDSCTGGKIRTFSLKG